MDIALGADHAGFALKEKIKQELERMGHRVHDVGTTSSDPVDYPDYAERVAERVVAGEDQRGVLVCGTGAGMAMAANKVPGVRAANVYDVAGARLSREHNDANILALGARLIDEPRALDILHAWMEAQFNGQRHQRRVRKIAELENKARERKPG